MRIATLAVALCADSRSTNIVRALRLIDAAARTDPAPDLIVIPPGCDRVRHPRHKLSAAMAGMFQAALSGKAREWGVLIAVGLRRRTAQGTEDVGVLLDADGDQCWVCRPGEHPEYAQDTLFGPMHVCCDAEDLASASTVAIWPHARLTVVLAQPESDGVSVANDRRKCKALARETRSCVILARGSKAADGGSARVCCSDPALLGEPAELPDGRVTPAELPADRVATAGVVGES